MNRAALFLSVVLLGGAALADGDAPTAPVAAAAPIAHDVVTLKDGRKLEGRVVGQDDRFVSVEVGGVTRAYAKDTVQSIELAPRQPSSDAPPAKPASPAGAPVAPGGPKEKKGARRDAPLSDAARKWLDDLIARTADADETVRRSTAAAIRELVQRGREAPAHVA